MFMLKLSLAIIFSFQVSTCVVGQVNVTDDAQKALDLFYKQIAESTSDVLVEATTQFSSYISQVSLKFNDSLQTDTTNIRYTVGNISTIAVDVASGRDCIQLVLSSLGYASDVFIDNELIAENLFFLAQADISNAFDQFTDLNNEFVANCVQDKRNCEGTSRAVITEVERLLPNVKRIPFDLLSEIHIVGYKLSIDLDSAHAELMEIYNKAIQNATLCIATKIAAHEQESGPPVPSGSISDLFEDLIYVIEECTATSAVIMDQRENQAIRESAIDYLNYVDRLSTVTSRANNAIQSLIHIAEEYNVTQNCAIPDLSLITNSSSQRIENEFELLLNGTAERRFYRGMKDIDSIGREIHSITLEWANCADDASCDYLAEKIASRLSEIPWKMQQVTNSTVVLFQQLKTAVRESGARVVRDTEEQLEVGLIDLKGCIQSSF